MIHQQYMLDTNSVSHLMRQHPIVTQRVIDAPMPSLCISVITAGELRYGLAKRPDAVRLHAVVAEFLNRVDILPWTVSTAERYGIVRAQMERRGKSLAPLDLLIAAHALDMGATLVTSDRALAQVLDLRIEDWTG